MDLPAPPYPRASAALLLACARSRRNSSTRCWDFFERCQDELVDPAAFSAWVKKLASGEKRRCHGWRSRKKLADIPRDEQIARWQEIAHVLRRVRRCSPRPTSAPSAT